GQQGLCPGTGSFRRGGVRGSPDRGQGLTATPDSSHSFTSGSTGRATGSRPGRRQLWQSTAPETSPCPLGQGLTSSRPSKTTEASFGLRTRPQGVPKDKIFSVIQAPASGSSETMWE